MGCHPELGLDISAKVPLEAAGNRQAKAGSPEETAEPQRSKSK